MHMDLNEHEKKLLLGIARSSIEAAARREQWKPQDVPGSLKVPRGAFVTIRQAGELRGCIGFIEARLPLHRSIAEVAGKAATEDPRFPPVSRDEVGSLEIEISVLSDLTPVRDIQEIEVGRHGLVLEAGWVRGLLLPQVAVEYGWNREEFLNHTAQKAGLSPDAWKSGRLRISTFTTETFSESELLELH